MPFLNKTMKLLHVIGSLGFCAALLALIMLHAALPDPEDQREFMALRVTMGLVAGWLLLPSTLLVLVSGLLAMALSEAYKNAGWVWAKLATGVLVMEGTLVYVQAPLEKAAANAQALAAGMFDPGELGVLLEAERNSVGIILGVAMVNILLGVYRPRFTRRLRK